MWHRSQLPKSQADRINFNFRVLVIIIYPNIIVASIWSVSNSFNDRSLDYHLPAFDKTAKSAALEISKAKDRVIKKYVNFQRLLTALDVLFRRNFCK